jgi:hypothetical protein
MLTTADPVTPVPVVPRSPSAGLSRRQIIWRTAAHAAWITALAGFLVLRVGRFGFNPSDQGFVLALSWRVLNGEIPHVDIVSPRPLGSAYLHLLEFVLPGPLFLASGFVTDVGIIVATIACAALITRVSPLRWGPLRTLLVAAAAVVNLHTFPMMAWHTIDGILLTSVGWWLMDSGLRSRSAGRRRTGLFLLGFAVMVKQSFLFAPLAGVLLLLFHPAEDWRANLRSGRWWRRTVVDLVWLGGFPILYVGLVTAAGGLVPMVEQLTGGAGAWGNGLYEFWFAGDFVVGDVRRHILMVAAFVVLAAASWLVRGWLGGAAVWVRLVPLAGAAVVTVYALAQTHLSFPGSWATKLLWLLIAVIVLDAVVHRHLPWRPLLIVLLGYMISLSWGYSYPGLLAGTLVLTTLELLARAAPENNLSGRGWLVPQALVGVVALGSACLGLVSEHDRAPVIDLPRAQLTAGLGAATPEMRGIRTNPSTALYVEQIGDCLRRYPAGQVAVLPDSPFAYPAFGIENPFPVDWPLEPELVADAPQRMLDTVTRLNQDGDYLVLFATQSTWPLRNGQPVPASVRVDAPHVSVSFMGLEDRIRDGLTGQRVSCGSFVGVWAPRE